MLERQHDATTNGHTNGHVNGTTNGTNGHAVSNGVNGNHPNGQDISNGHATNGHPTPPTPAPIKALFTETPSNPLLRTADLRRLRALADKFGFVIVVDDTVGSWVNVDVMGGRGGGGGYADVVVSSLTKWFSGRANVMGGR